jgi:hypothetical protein
VLNDAVAVYVSNPTCAAAFVARWCVPGDPPGFYRVRDDEPAAQGAASRAQHATLGDAILGLRRQPVVLGGEVEKLNFEHAATGFLRSLRPQFGRLVPVVRCSVGWAVHHAPLLFRAAVASLSCQCSTGEPVLK